MFGSGRVVRRTHSQLLHPYYLREGTCDERVERDVLRSAPLYLKHDFGVKPQWIIDAGANIGLRSIWFASLFPEARIVAIEPATNNFELLQKNTEKYNNITCIKAGLWKSDAFLGITNPGDDPWGFIVEERTSNESGNAIRAVSMPSLLEQFSIGQVDVLKIDIEGSEKEVFDHSVAWIDKVNIFFIELHDRVKPGCSRAFFNAINHFDYDLSLESTGDNLLVRRTNPPSF